MTPVSRMSKFQLLDSLRLCFLLNKNCCSTNRRNKKEKEKGPINLTFKPYEVKGKSLFHFFFFSFSFVFGDKVSVCHNPNY